MKTVEWYQLSKFKDGKYVWTGTVRIPNDYIMISDENYYWTKDKTERDKLNHKWKKQLV